MLVCSAPENTCAPAVGGILAGVLAWLLLFWISAAPLWAQEEEAAPAPAETPSQTCAPAPAAEPALSDVPVTYESPGSAAAPASGLTLHCFKIVGAHYVKASDIKKQMSMPLPPLIPIKKLIPGKAEKIPFNKEDLEADIDQIKLFYRTQGFYHATITPRINRKDGKVDVVLYIIEGPWVKVTSLIVHGTEAIDAVGMATIEGDSELHVGGRYSDDRYENLKRSYLGYLQNHGYYRAKVTGKVYLDDKADTARVIIDINPGPLSYFGDIKVEGAELTPEFLIRQKLTFKPGEVYSASKTFDSQKNLYDTDLFQSVSIIPGDVPANETTIPMTVSVKEKKQRSLRLGVGYGDEDLLRTKFNLRIRNLGGGGRLLDLEAKYSAIESKGTATLTNPQIFGSRFDFATSAGWVHRELPSFNDNSYYTYERLERDLPWKFRVYFGHAYEYARPYDIPLSTLLILENTAPGKAYRSSMGIWGLSQDTTVTPNDPTGGGKIIINGECATDFLGSNLEFFRMTAEVRRYHTIVKDVVISGRLKFGIIQPIQETDQIPIQRRFFSGGYDSNRGYRLDYLGPRSPSGDPLGGDVDVEGNLQIRVPLYNKLRAVGFVDFGNVYFKASDIDLGRLKYAVGCGINYLTPIGPIGIYLAQPTNPINPRTDTLRVHFTIGPSF